MKPNAFSKAFISLQYFFNIMRLLLKRTKNKGHKADTLFGGQKNYLLLCHRDLNKDCKACHIILLLKNTSIYLNSKFIEWTE